MKFPIRYAVSLLLVILAFVLGVCLLTIWIPTLPLPHYWVLTLAALFILTLLSHIVVRVSTKPFIQIAISSMVARIFIYGLLALFLIFFHPDEAIVDIIYFMILYLILTIHELIGLVRFPFKDPPSSPL